ncbi:MAG TPA: glycosyltransferase family 4 protein [Chitinophagaceae bacterium]
MKSVLFISLMNSDVWGGSEEIWYQAALWLAKEKHKIGVCFFGWPGKENRIEEFKKAGCTVFLLPGKNETRSIIGRFRLKHKLRSVPFHQYDHVVVNQGGWKDVVHSPFKNLWKKLPSYSLLFHNYNIEEKVSGQKLKCLGDWVNYSKVNMGAAARIFTETIKAYSVKIPNHRVLYNPITFTPPKETVHYPSISDKINFSMLAALDTERKAQDVLVKALANDKWKNRDWELNLFGHGKDEQVLKRIIIENGLESKVFLRGHTTNVKEALTNSHLILQITRIDAMPISVLEAMAMARPIVVSDVGDMQIWVQEGVNGWTADAVSTVAIDQVLETAWNKKERWAEMGKESFRIFHQKYPADPVQHFLTTAAII